MNYEVFSHMPEEIESSSNIKIKHLKHYYTEDSSILMKRVKPARVSFYEFITFNTIKEEYTMDVV